jgi:murein DD-endopeptidase MepM/ murein hydrolase activator NlpD
MRLLSRLVPRPVPRLLPAVGGTAAPGPVARSGLVLLGLLLALGYPGVPGASGPVTAPLDVPAATAADPWVAPVDPVTVVVPFDGPAQPWLAGHRGVDLAAPVGAPVAAPRAGTVTFAGVVVDRPVLTVRHDDGLCSSVEPVEALVAVGDRVAGGAVVGTVSDARSHCSPTCLHWGVREGETYLDPMLLLRGGPAVLLSRGPPGISPGRPR